MPNGGTVKLTIDSDKEGYVRLPNGGVLTTVAGVINETYNGATGRITYYVPKDNVSVININDSGLIGELVYNGSGSIELSLNHITKFTSETQGTITTTGCDLLTDIVAPNTVYVSAVGCALTAKSIGDILFEAYTDNRPNVTFNFTGGTNANSASIDYYIGNEYSTDLQTILDGLVADGGVITLTT